jgi:hypothetical protein
VSCKQISNAAFAKTIPVKPPKVNKIMNAMLNSIEGESSITPPHKVANQLKTFIPVGIAIIIVAVVKNTLESTSIPTVYI